MKRHWNTIVIVMGVVGFLTLASYFTSSIQWDGGFPPGEFRVNVRDANGTPVEGAVLRVFRGGTSDLAFQYPLDNHLEDQELISNEKGQITAIRESGRLQFGGHAWQLFWVIPMGAKVPQYDCEITAEGYKSLLFGVQKLFESPHEFYEDFPKTKLIHDGEEIELPIYEHDFTLER